jgi:hypothetical protein
MSNHQHFKRPHCPIWNQRGEVIIGTNNALLLFLFFFNIINEQGAVVNLKVLSLSG